MRTPTVWILEDDRPGNSSQSLGLADALGWPYERKPLRMGPLSMLHNRLLGARRLGLARDSATLEPPWPDLVIAAGRRTAPVARWIRGQSEGRTRLVQLGRKGADDADLFDLCVVPEYCRLFPHPRRFETSAPLHRLTPEKLSAAAGRWKERLEVARPPRIAVLVGGPSGQFDLDAPTARRLGEEVMRLAREVGASVVATTSRRTPPAADRAFCAALAGAAFVHGWSTSEPEDNPYLAFLALADALVVTGDSESMLGEATSLGKPVYIYPLPVRRSFRLLGLFRDGVLACATAANRASGSEDAARPARGLAWLCQRLIERGWVRPTRDLTVLHDVLIRRGLARPFGERFSHTPGPPRDDKQDVTRRVRELLGSLP